MSQNENPITSVPEPSSSSSSDPLANIITQVSPTAAGAPSRGGPARPTRVAKQQGEKKKKKEKKDDVATTAPAAAVASDSKTEEAGELGEQSHSHKASSTLVGTTTTKGSNIIPQSDSEKVGLSQDKPVDAAATPTEPDPVGKPAGAVSSDGQDMTSAAEKIQSSEMTQPSSTKTASAPKSNEVRDAKPSKAIASPSGPSSAKPSEGRSTVGGQEKPSMRKKKAKKGFVSKMIAVLTCSGASGAAIAAEEGEEMREKRNGRLSGSAKKGSPATASRSAPRSTTKGPHTPSNRGSLDKTAIGGGTRLPRDETGDVMSGAVVPPGSSFVVQDGDAKKGGAVGSSSSSVHKGEDDEEDGNEEDDDEEWMGEEQLDDDEDQTEEQRLILQGGAGIPRDELGNLQPLLGPIGEIDQGRKCLVLDLDETLVHSSFKMISNADFTVPVEIEGTVHNVYVIKRPGVDEFMRKMGELYEVVVFTASLSKYADPVLDILDIHQVVRHRLFRESCYNHRGNYVKDLSQLGRDIETSIIIDNSPASYIFHPNNAVPISSWFNDPHDTELTDLCPFWPNWLMLGMSGLF